MSGEAGPFSGILMRVGEGWRFCSGKAWMDVNGCAFWVGKVVLGDSILSGFLNGIMWLFDDMLSSVDGREGKA